MIILFLFLFGNLFAQNGSLKFSAGNIYKTSMQLTGDSTTWSVVISLAQRDVANNGFVLSKAAIVQLKKFSTLHKQLLDGKKRFNTLLKAGARVFASAKLDNATRLIAEYDAQLKEGSLTTVTKIGSDYLQTLNEIEKEIREKRNEDIDARIAQKHGTVDKRKGFLGNWITALKDDLLAQSDGVKTGNASFAQLAFTDGVEVMIDQGSTVVIRQSKMDKLDQSVRRDIALVKGSLLTKFSASAKERNNFTFQAGTSESQVKSGKFWASAIEERRVKLSNYDGTMDVNASNSNVRLASNEGTVVEKGKAPLPAVALLPPPQLQWDGIDSVIYNDNFKLQWNGVHGSVLYTIEVSMNKEFNNAVKKFSATQTLFTLKHIDLGIIFVRLYALDKLGLRGIESPTYKLVRVEDKLPPAIYVDGWETDRQYTALSALTIKGSTEPDAKFVVDGKQITLGSNGTFTFTTPIERNEKQIKISATDRSGNTRERILSIVEIDSNRVKKIDWNCPANETTVSPATDDMSARGTAYPQMRISVTHGMEKIQVQTDSQGNWAISLKRVKGEQIIFVFESISDNKIIVTKTLTVQ